MYVIYPDPGKVLGLETNGLENCLVNFGVRIKKARTSIRAYHFKQFYYNIMLSFSVKFNGFVLSVDYCYGYHVDNFSN